MTFKNLSENLTIVKKAWKLEDKQNLGFKIEVNDTKSHSIIDRIKNRTNIKLNDMNTKLQKGVDLILFKVSKGFFKKDVSFIELTYKESNFKAIFMLKLNSKYLRVSSIFPLDFSTENALIWDINEFLTVNPELKKKFKHTDLNESKVGFYVVDEYSVEMNEPTDSYVVYLSDIEDVITLEVE